MSEILGANFPMCSKLLTWARRIVPAAGNGVASNGQQEKYFQSVHRCDSFWQELSIDKFL